MHQRTRSTPGCARNHTWVVTPRHAAATVQDKRVGEAARASLDMPCLVQSTRHASSAAASTCLASVGAVGCGVRGEG